jgi:hypothetical protein
VLLERLIDWLTRDYVAMLGKLSDFRDTLHVALIERFCRRAQEGKATTLDTPSLVKILEFFRPRIEREKHLSFAINVKLILEQLLDNGYPSYAIWLFTQQLRTQNLIRIAPSFSWAFSNLEGKNADGTSELEVQFDFRFVDQLSEHRSRELFDKVLRPRISAVGSRLVHALTQVFLEIRAFDQLGRQYSSTDGRSAIEQHQQDRYRNGPTHNVLNLLRDAWEALLSADRGSAESAHCGWEHIDDGLIQRLRIHAMRRLLETQ